MSFKGRIRRLDDKLERVKAVRGRTREWPADPVEFCVQYLGFTPTVYQEKLLRDPAQFIVARWSRQSGKTHCVAVLLLWSCLRNRGFNVLVLAPAVRQSKIIIRKITGFLTKLPKYVALKPLKTKIEFYNGSRIQAFPNSPETIRGEPGVNLLYCLPPGTPILSADGTYKPICQLKPGERVVTFNTFTRLLEAKRILKVIMNPLAGRKIVRISHDTGSLECTADHRVFTTNRDFVPASRLTSEDQILRYWEVQASTFENLQLRTGASHPRRPLGRLLPLEKDHCTKRISHRESLVQASRVRSVQVLDPEGLRQDPSTHNQERWLGHVEHFVSHSEPSKTHRDLPVHLPEWKENDYDGMAGENYFSPRSGGLVHGRRFKQQVDCHDLNSRVLSCGLRPSQAMAPFQLWNTSNGSRRQTWDRQLPKAKSGATRKTLRTYSPSHNPQYGVQSPHSTQKKDRTNSVQTGSTVSSRLHNLWSTVRNLQTKPDHLQFPVWSRKETPSSPYVPRSIQSEKKISTNYLQNDQDISSETMYLLWDDLPTSQQSSDDMWRDLSREPDPTEPQAVRVEKIEEFVYDLEVEDNHNFFANGVLVSNCDEFGYIKGDRELYEAAIFSLATTNGRFVATSTPGSRESMFYAMCTDDVNYGDVSRHHVSYLDALEPNGPLKLEILEKLKRQFAPDPWRWRREMEAEFADDADSWLSMALITRCVDPRLEYIREGATLGGPIIADRKFYVTGVDLGQKQDHSVVAGVDKGDRGFDLVLLKQFELGTEYGSVVGYLKLLNENLHDLRRIMIDQTGVGETFMSMAINSGLKNARGIMLSQPKKQDVMTFLKHCMEDGLVHIPYDREFMNELNVERFELLETGRLKFSHPPGTHDDRLWAFALAIYYARLEPTEYHPVAAVNTRPSPGNLFPQLPKSIWKR